MFINPEIKLCSSVARYRVRSISVLGFGFTIRKRIVCGFFFFFPNELSPAGYPQRLYITNRPSITIEAPAKTACRRSSFTTTTVKVSRYIRNRSIGNRIISTVQFKPANECVVLVDKVFDVRPGVVFHGSPFETSEGKIIKIATKSTKPVDDGRRVRSSWIFGHKTATTTRRSRSRPIPIRRVVRTELFAR